MTSASPGEVVSGQDGRAVNEHLKFRSRLPGQAEWAGRNGLDLTRNGAYLPEGSAAVFGGLHPETCGQLFHGAGKGLRRLPSLRSSTTLALNVFQPWKAPLE